MELKSPTPKRKGSHIPKSAPLPVLCDSSTFFDEYGNYGTFSGYFNGNSVIIDDPEEIKALYTMGYFGKASLSKGFPNFGKHKMNEPAVLRETQWQRRKEWSDKLKSLIETLQKNKSKGEHENNSATGVLDENALIPLKTSMDIGDDATKPGEDNVSGHKELPNEESDQELFTNEINLSISEAHNLSEFTYVEDKDVLVISDCNDANNLSNLNPHIEVVPVKTVMEVLYLTLEEAFFLSFALGCLHVLDLTGKPLTLLQLWRVFNYSQPDFIENYVAYHYFRAKGWVVKSGLKFGGNFILYKDGPPFFHASYIVVIENITRTEDGHINNKEGHLTWDKMNTFNRMAETCNKEIIICKIQWPEMTSSDREHPLILKKFKVKEFLLRRWQPCQEKQIND